MESTASSSIGRQMGKLSLHEAQGMPVHGSKLWHGSMSSTSISNGVRVRGCERLASVQTTSGVAPGALMNRISLNPKLFGVRLPLVAEQYDKFVFKRVTLHYVPSITLVNPNANGTIYMVAAYDPEEPIPTNLDSIAAWAQNKTVFPVYEHAQLDLDLRLSMQEPLFCDSTDEVRFGVQAILALVAGDTQTVTSACGQWFIDYDIELSSVSVNSTEASQSLTIKYLNAQNGEGGAALNARAVAYAGDPDIATLPPAGSTASLILAPGFYMVTALTRSTAVLTASSGTPGLQCFAVNNMDGTYLGAQASTSGPAYTMANGIVQLATPSAAFGGNGILDSSDAISFQSINFFTRAGGTPSSIRFALPAITTTPALPGWCIDVLITRFPVSSYNILGSSAYSSANFRPLPNVVLNAKLSQALINYDLDAEVGPFLEEARLFVRNHDPCESYYADLINRCFNLGEQVPVQTTSTMFVHTAAEIALFLIKKFGPTVAAHVLGIAKDRLAKWLEKH